MPRKDGRSQKDKWFTRIFVGYIGIGVLPLFFIDTASNAEFTFAFKYLTLPFILVSYLLIGTLLRKTFKDEHILLRLLSPLIIALVCTFCSGGYVSIVNMMLGPQTPATVEGRVVEKDWIGGRYGKSYYLDIETFRAEGLDTVRLNIQKRFYDGIKVGDIYSRDMVRGGLGFLYKKRW